ncbi:ubiquitin carboxyl-terminal hydrolase 17-like protein B [Branchiostoma floridae x Branchiostoma japonicum]
MLRRTNYVHQLYVEKMPLVKHESTDFQYLLVIEDVLSSWTVLKPLAAPRDEEGDSLLQCIADTLTEVYSEPFSGGPPDILSKRQDKSGAEYLSNMLSTRLECRMDFTGIFLDNPNSKSDKRVTWSNEVKEVVLGVSEKKWFYNNVLGCVETTLNSSTFYKDLGGHTPYKMYFGVRSARETRDPFEPDGVCDNSKEDVIARAKRYYEEAEAVQTGNADYFDGRQLVPPTVHPDHDYTLGASGQQPTNRERRRQGPGIVAIENQGNHCYVISLLQALAALRADVMYGEDPAHRNTSWATMLTVIRSLGTVVETPAILHIKRKIESIKHPFPAFANNRQQDVFDFFVAVMNFQHCPSCERQSCVLLNRLFSVLLATHFKCVCQAAWEGGVVRQHYIDLYLPSDRNGPTTLQDLVNEHFRDYKCQVACAECGANNQDSTGRNVLSEASPMLAVRVRRWDTTEHGASGLKDTRVINFNMGGRITLTKHNGENLTYKVKAAVIHHGPTTSNGHYTAVVEVDNRTYEADDDYTNTITTLTEAHFTQCYMFFLSEDN